MYEVVVSLNVSASQDYEARQPWASLVSLLSIIVYTSDSKVYLRISLRNGLQLNSNKCVHLVFSLKGNVVIDPKNFHKGKYTLTTVEPIANLRAIFSTNIEYHHSWRTDVSGF